VPEEKRLFILNRLLFLYKGALHLTNYAEADIKHSLPRRVAMSESGRCSLWSVVERAASSNLRAVVNSVGGFVRIRLVCAQRPLGDIAVHIMESPGVGLIPADIVCDDCTVIYRLDAGNPFWRVSPGQSADSLIGEVGVLSEIVVKGAVVHFRIRTCPAVRCGLRAGFRG